jgi:hypothetical protein
MQFRRSQAGKIAGYVRPGMLGPDLERSVLRRRQEIMKKIKSMFFTALVIGVLCAGTVSARQLHSGAKSSTTCGGSCSATQPCAKGCVCSFTTPFTAFCTTKPAGVAPSGK